MALSRVTSCSVTKLERDFDALDTGANLLIVIALQFLHCIAALIKLALMF